MRPCIQSTTTRLKKRERSSLSTSRRQRTSSMNWKLKWQPRSVNKRKTSVSLMARTFLYLPRRVPRRMRWWSQWLRSRSRPRPKMSSHRSMSQLHSSINKPKHSPRQLLLLPILTKTLRLILSAKYRFASFFNKGHKRDRDRANRISCFRLALAPGGIRSLRSSVN